MNSVTGISPQAVLIDLDDTIIQDDALSDRIWRYIGEKYAPLIGRTTPEGLIKTIRTTTGAFWADPENHRRGRQDLYQTRRELVALALTASGLGDQKLGHQIADDFSAEKNRLLEPFPGALATLIKLRERGIPLALLTNGGQITQRYKIERFGLDRFFDCILVEGEFGAGKPDPRVFEFALQKLKAEAAASWMVGDDLNRDIVGAMRLGIRGIWIDRRGAGLPAQAAVVPDRIIRSLAELI
jgi:putative hydrolase of the HAD superfamily